jgi:Trypsin-like peptidase domain
MKPKPFGLALLATLLIVGVRVGWCQDFDDLFLNSTVLVKYQIDAAHESLGTGFLIFSPVASAPNQSSYKVYLVTNKHVLPHEHGATNITIRLAVRVEGRDPEVKEVTIPILGQDGKYLKKVGLHPDTAVDVAVVHVTQDLIKEHADILEMAAKKHKAVTTDLLIAKRDLQEAAVGIGTQIYLLGYLAGIYDPRNASPILRIGIIATDPQEDSAFNPELRQRYRLPTKIPGFLIDANVFPGSSGSMVVRRTNIVPGFSPGGKRSVPYILGIVSLSIPIDDLGETQRMGLGVVYSASAVKELIELTASQD